MSVNFQGTTQIQAVDGFVDSVFSLFARQVTQSAVARCDWVSAGGDFGSLGADRGKV